MDYNTWEKKLQEMMEKEISDYKKLVGKLPDDEKILPFIPVLANYENNIANLIDVYTSAKSLKMVGRPIICEEKRDGTLHYQTNEKTVKKQDDMYI